MPDCEKSPVEYEVGMTDVSQRIRDLRTHLGLSQKDFAHRAGVTQATISKWEAGSQTPNGPALINLARIAGTDVFSFSEEAKKLADQVKKKTYTIPVEGVLQKNVFREKAFWTKEEEYKITVPFPPDMNDIEGYAFEIRGDFVSGIYPEGSIVIFSRVQDESDLVSGDILYIITIYKDGRREHCPWLLRISGNVSYILSASTNFEISERHFLNPEREDDPEVERRLIVGVAITSVTFDRNPIPGRRRKFETE